MQILVGWDDAKEAELIALYLNVDDNRATITTEQQAFQRAAASGTWDVALLAVSFPTPEECLQMFGRLRPLLPDTPILAAARPLEIFQLAQFVAIGLNSHLLRDPSGDYIFLLMPTLRAAHEAFVAERTRKLAERLRQEIESVRRLQESVIPRSIVAPRGYEVVARYEPSQIQVIGTTPVVLAGGDYYDVFSLRESELVLLVGDASGHGMKACMSIMTMHTLIRMIRENLYPNTADFVTEVNKRLCEHNIIQDEGGFITLLYCALNTRTHMLEWTSAGHNVPLIQDLTTNEVRPIGTEVDGGLPLGISSELPYEVLRHPVPANSRILLYTDGLSEAFPDGTDRHEEFGLEGIVGAMKAAAELPLDQAMETLFIASRDYAGGQGRHDDTSVVLLQRGG
jgi:serine phosphatase RsbU (regulator of sigma subunit)